MLVIKPKDVSFPGLPLTRKSNVKRTSDLVTLELQQKFLVFGAALQHKVGQGARVLCTQGKPRLRGAEEGVLAIHGATDLPGKNPRWSEDYHNAGYSGCRSEIPNLC